jgi:uncharacterized membrane protein YdjX (TVP38/TMEM64 family)
MRKSILIISILLLILFISYLIKVLYPFNPKHIKEIVEKTGTFMPIVLIFFHTFQVIIAPVPGQIFPFLMGFFYGVYWGILMAVTGNLLGSFIGFALGKLGKKELFDIEKIKKFEKYRDKIIKNSTIWLIILFILPLPGLPKDLLCYFAGFIGVKLKDFIISVLIGRTITESIWVLAGAGILKAITI